jgi:hypothetical protein
MAGLFGKLGALWRQLFGILGAEVRHSRGIYNPDVPVPNPVVGLCICGLPSAEAIRAPPGGKSLGWVIDA